MQIFSSEIEDFISNDETIFNKVVEFNENANFINSDLLVLHVNIRSVRKNIDNLDAFINTFSNKPDVIVCSECWLKDDINFITLNGQTQIISESRINKADGVVIFVKLDLSFDTISEQYNDLKIPSITVQLSDKSSIKISGVYRCHQYEIVSFVTDLAIFK